MNNPRPVQTSLLPPEPHYRATFSLPASLAKDINRLAKRLGVSQSSMLSELLKEPIASMLDILDELPTQAATDGDVKRAKGKSVAYIEAIVAEAASLAAEARAT